MHRGDALSDAHRSCRSPVVDDRDRGREDLLAERPRGSLDLDLPARERRLRSRAGSHSWSRPRLVRRCQRARGRSRSRSGHGRGPTTPRCGRAFRAPAGWRRRAGPPAVAATRSACAWACVRTSAFTRALRFSASGTPNATIASSSTYATAPSRRARRLMARLPLARRGRSRRRARCGCRPGRRDRRRACAAASRCGRRASWSSRTSSCPRRRTSATRA